MTKEDLIFFLNKKTSYLKKGPGWLAKRFNLSKGDAYEALQEVKKHKKQRKGPLIKRLFFDIETSPNVVYTWRAGYNITISHDSIIKERRIISIHWKWQYSNKVYNLCWDENQNDKKMLKEFMDVLNGADECVAHNGDRFDIRWLRTRCLYHGIPMIANVKTLDTRKKAKSHFYFNSNKLDYIAKFVGVGKKLDHEGYELWLKVMDGDKEALKRMLEYGDHDVVILEMIYHKMKNYIRHNVHHGVLKGHEKTSCPNCTNEKISFVKLISTPMGTVQVLVKCNNCDYIFKLSYKKYLNM